MRTLTYIIAIIVLASACTRNFKSKPTAPVEKLEMIFGQEKKDLEAFKSEIDRLVANVDNLPIDTLNYEKGTVQHYIVYDSLMNTEGVHDIYQGDIIQRELNDASKDRKSINNLELEYVLKAKIKRPSYSTYLNDLKKVNYLILTKTISLLMPKEDGNNSFISGFALGIVYLIDVKMKKIVCIKVLQVESSAQVEATSFGISQGILNTDFWKNYRKERASVIYTILN